MFLEALRRKMLKETTLLSVITQLTRTQTAKSHYRIKSYPKQYIWDFVLFFTRTACGLVLCKPAFPVQIKTDHHSQRWWKKVVSEIF